MLIERVSAYDRDGWSGIVAVVVGRAATHDVHIEVPSDYKGWLASGPDAFLAICAPLASQIGEDELVVEGACPLLLNGVRLALDLLAQWYPERYDPPVTIKDVNPEIVRPPRHDDRLAASFLSGGIDSLTALRTNHQEIPVGSAARIAACINVDPSLGNHLPDGDMVKRFGEVSRERLIGFGRQVGIEVVPVRTDYRKLVNYVEGHEWADAHHGLVYIGIAHALTNRINRVTIASTNPLWKLRPWGSHPLIDCNLASSSLYVHHDGMRMNRLDKIRVVADWPASYGNVSVCVGPWADRIERTNCGNCEKCIRTAAGFVACDAPDAATHLLGRPLTIDDLDAVTPPTKGVATAWADMADACTDAEWSGAARRASRRYRRSRRMAMARRAAGPVLPVLRALRGRSRGELSTATLCK